mgnify:CR=1 FL=1
MNALTAAPLTAAEARDLTDRIRGAAVQLHDLLLEAYSRGAWSALGSGVTGQVTSMCVYDDGDGPMLYVGGTFTSAGGVTSNRIARWDGAAWFAVGDGAGLQGATPGTK